MHDDQIEHLIQENLALEANVKRLRASLERLLEEFDFMIEADMIPDTRNDIIFVEARAALAEGD